jgi:hypothetical protein
MTAVSSGFVSTVSKTGGWPPMKRASGSTSEPSSNAGSSGIEGCGNTISVRHAGTTATAAFVASAIGSSGVPWKQKTALASLSRR